MYLAILWKASYKLEVFTCKHFFANLFGNFCKLQCDRLESDNNLALLNISCMPSGKEKLEVNFFHQTVPEQLNFEGLPEA